MATRSLQNGDVRHGAPAAPLEPTAKHRAPSRRREGPERRRPTESASQPPKNQGIKDVLETLDVHRGMLSSRELGEIAKLLRNDTRRFEETCDFLMDLFRRHRSQDAFSLLFQLNRDRFRRIIQAMVRRNDGPFDTDDVLAEVFMAIWRYPHKFRVEKANAFRNWSYGIIRNTIRNLIRVRRPEPVDAELFSELMSDEGVGDPSRVISGRESLHDVGETYFVLLAMYRKCYHEVLNDRERKALWLVEVEGKSYRDAAEELSVTLGNLKMIICRARKKIRATFDAIAEKLGIEGWKNAA